MSSIHKRPFQELTNSPPKEMGKQLPPVNALFQTCFELLAAGLEKKPDEKESLRNDLKKIPPREDLLHLTLQTLPYIKGIHSGYGISTIISHLSEMHLNPYELGANRFELAKVFLEEVHPDDKGYFLEAFKDLPPEAIEKVDLFKDILMNYIIKMPTQASTLLLYFVKIDLEEIPNRFKPIDSFVPINQPLPDPLELLTQIMEYS